MKNIRSPIEMLIDKACGVTKPLKGGSDQRFVQFRCPKCKRVAKVKRDETDPPNCAVVEISCPDCNPGDRELIDYFDADGQQIDCDGKKLNVSDQTPRTQDVANTTDSLERLSASVLFGLLLLVGFISGPSSVGAQETPIDHPRPAESHRTTDKMDNTGNPIILGNEAEPRLEALSADTYGKSAFGSFGEPSPQTSGTAHSALESSLTDQVGSLSGGERASESTMQARRLSPTGFVLLGVIVQLLLMAATWSNVVPVEHPKWLSLNIRYTAVAVLITMLLQPYVLSLVSSLESSGALIHCPNDEMRDRHLKQTQPEKETSK